MRLISCTEREAADCVTELEDANLGCCQSYCGIAGGLDDDKDGSQDTGRIEVGGRLRHLCCCAGAAYRWGMC